MPKSKSNEEFQDQGSLDQPEQSTEGPVNPVLDEHLTNPAGTFETLKSLGEQETVEVDDSSAGTLERVNEARDAGEPMTGALGDGTGDQPAATPAGTGVSEGATAGSVDT